MFKNIISYLFFGINKYIFGFLGSYVPSKMVPTYLLIFCGNIAFTLFQISLKDTAFGSSKQ